MDKQKQIEELSNDLKQIRLNMHGCFIPQYVGVHEDITARDLYELGYRKIDKGSVVLTQEEWANLHEYYAKALYEKDTQARKQAIEEYAEKLHSSLDKSIPALNGVLVMLVKNIVDNTAKELGVKLQKSVEICKNTQKHANFENHTSDPDWN